MYNFATKVRSYCYISRLLRNFFFWIMKKSLLLVVILLLSQLNSLQAQTLFTAPDTVCVGQPVKVNSTIFDAASYYWGFCSGAINYAPTGTNMGSGFDFHTPSAIETIRDRNGLYYGFVLNAGTDELLRLNYGTSLNNVPTVTNFGNLTNGLPHHPTNLHIVYDTVATRWHIFVAGGYTAGESTVARVDFGPTLSNPTPNVANFGNLGGLLNGPRGLFVMQDADLNWYGYVVNRYDNLLIRFDLTFNVSNTPTNVQSLGNPGGVLNFPSDMAGIIDNNQYYFFVTNRGNNTIARISLGSSLNTTTPAGTNLGDFLFRVLEPSSISLTRDCGGIFAYITDSSTSQLVCIQMQTALGIYTPVTYSVVGGMNFPSGISGILRDKDDLYAFVVNTFDSTLTKLTINQCTNASIPSFTEVTPPVFSYNTPGTYNIYYTINDGQPNMQVECKQIVVMPTPNIFINVNPTICKGDSIKLYAISNYANSIRWTTNYNIDTVYHHTDTALAWPDYTTTYYLTLQYPDGCIVDTSIHVNVIKVTADAGPDRTIADGAVSVLGGPGMSIGDGYSYHWNSYQYVDDTALAFPTARPPFDITYDVTVTEHISGLGCQDRDTVTVRLNCGDIYAPNAFAPASTSPGANRFGILNLEMIQLNYLRVYDRWGVLVFQTSSPTQMWDGTYNGTPCPTGVYVWEADGFCSSNKHVKKQGNVSLLR